MSWRPRYGWTHFLLLRNLTITQDPFASPMVDALYLLKDVWFDHFEVVELDAIRSHCFDGSLTFLVIHNKDTRHRVWIRKPFVVPYSRCHRTSFLNASKTMNGSNSIEMIPTSQASGKDIISQTVVKAVLPGNGRFYSMYHLYILWQKKKPWLSLVWPDLLGCFSPTDHVLNKHPPDH